MSYARDFVQFLAERLDNITNGLINTQDVLHTKIFGISIILGVVFPEKTKGCVFIARVCIGTNS